MSDTAIPTVDSSAPEKFLPLERASVLRRFWATYGTLTIVVAGIILFMLFWEWEATSLKIIEPYFIPPISNILQELKTNVLNGEIPYQMTFSLRNYVIGYVIGVGIAIPLGLVMGTFRIVNRLLSPYVWIMFVMPRIAFLPIVIIALGFGPEAKILFISLGCFFQVVIPTIAGVLTVSPSLVKVGRLFGGSRIQVYRKVVLPYALNFIITGMRLAARSGMMIMYSTEMFGAKNGIATWVILQADLFHMDAAFAGLMALVFLAVTLVSVIDVLDNRLRPWKSEVSF
jgi:ABC-type nitrate/sulfonate/bicarbonate transport system permease component